MTILRKNEYRDENKLTDGEPVEIKDSMSGSGDPERTPGKAAGVENPEKQGNECHLTNRGDHFAHGGVQADEDGAADDVVADVEFGDLGHCGERPYV